MKKILSILTVLLIVSNVVLGYENAEYSFKDVTIQIDTSKWVVGTEKGITNLELLNQYGLEESDIRDTLDEVTGINAFTRYSDTGSISLTVNYFGKYNNTSVPRIDLMSDEEIENLSNFITQDIGIKPVRYNDSLYGIEYFECIGEAQYPYYFYYTLINGDLYGLCFSYTDDGTGTAKSLIRGIVSKTYFNISDESFKPSTASKDTSKPSTTDDSGDMIAMVFIVIVCGGIVVILFPILKQMGILHVKEKIEPYIKKKEQAPKAEFEMSSTNKTLGHLKANKVEEPKVETNNTSSLSREEELKIMYEQIQKELADIEEKKKNEQNKEIDELRAQILKQFPDNPAMVEQMIEALKKSKK